MNQFSGVHWKWRMPTVPSCLKSTHSHSLPALVRKNASILLFDAFPLIQPDSSKREMDQLLQKQFDQMHDLLFDPAPIVRSVAVKGVCRILGVFWELIPTATINVLLSALIKDLVRDKRWPFFSAPFLDFNACLGTSSSSIVRASVFEGLKYLLENHLSQPSLKGTVCWENIFDSFSVPALLPQLTNLIHDHSDRVRASFVDLLCEIKKSRIIRFYDIVPVEHLLARLATGTSFFFPSFGSILNMLIHLPLFLQIRPHLQSDWPTFS